MNRPLVAANRWDNIKNSSQPTGKFDPLVVMVLFYFYDPSHMTNKFPKQVYFTKEAKRKMEYYAKKMTEKDRPCFYVPSFHQLEIEDATDFYEDKN